MFVLNESDYPSGNQLLLYCLHIIITGLYVWYSQEKLYHSCTKMCCTTVVQKCVDCNVQQMSQKILFLCFYVKTVPKPIIFYKLL